ncbi:MAG: hypothetical protein J7K11_00115, partial [Candidatus Hydrothermae bacterium]|nr:hypothetical protein [Candidatus Hydrothermae bacterium]
MRSKKKRGKLARIALPLYILAAAALFVLNSYIKLNYFGSAGLFYSDAAFRYRYAREFAMPFLILAVALFLLGLRSRNPKSSRALAVLSGLSFSAGLISWHLSPFFLALFVLFVALDIILD